MTVTAQDIARVAHEVNRAYCAALGDTSQPAWADAPDWQRQACLKGVSFHAFADHTPEQSHESWLEDKRENGWVYGPEKDENARTHPCMLPYADLPQPQRVKDHLFTAVVHAMRARLVDDADPREPVPEPEPERAAPPAPPSDDTIPDYLPPIGVLTDLRDGYVTAQAAEDFFVRHLLRATSALLDEHHAQEDALEAGLRGSLLDTFASMTLVQLGFNGLIDSDVAKLVMDKPMPDDKLAKLAWFAEAEGRMRYLKAEGMVKARNMGQ